ncbi:heat shock protein HspQ [Legionella micdadei]|uniref:Heat shock protein HspQ n=1 Tax=Legionella micdadei TaxID=451 RepID=A0A098GLH4_LEGMI|nr:heat shock protein HspQ [Legionella micdadei]ARG98750.1 DNA-binding protein [Legionella micdadei]ARH01469.1 DNA-binding protein [Legionella micdadei]KTD28973.1 putative DNA-binding protein hemimethylated [Legionella micdadei]NSL17184.1 heat shock protein HspQ [Legionella micdadei]CEG62356.1 putative DNA-binding protein hemimethylated [Legionella micdadei]
MKKMAKFNVGDCVIHLKLGYRAVIVDVDPLFQASGRYNPRANRYEFATRNPWYRLLVDGSNQMTYVEECFLKSDPSELAIDNPQIKQYLNEHQGRYHAITSRH